MTLRILPAFSAFATLALFSCYPYPEPPPREQKRPDATSVSDLEQQKIKDQRDRMKEAQKREEQAQANSNSNATQSGAIDTTVPPKPAEKKKVDTAQPVPGKPGFVFSPFNNKVIDVRGMPSGTLVADPTYDASEKKHFRVP